ncbi:hypothetical protein ACIGW7_03750 [Streptomyces sp. NPDC053253]|uniref:hypothetical protein n=1 Tax=Streptomyces sp. NPDC053253 TaxID=3365699 RepID=UPI0037CE80A8
MSDPQNVHNHDGPVFNAGVSHAQFAWNNETVTQNQQSNGGPVAPGYEALAELVTRLLGQLPAQGLADRDREDAEAAAQEVLTEITRTDAAPEEGRLRRALAGLRGRWPRWPRASRRGRRSGRRSGPWRRSRA